MDTRAAFWHNMQSMPVSPTHFELADAMQADPVRRVAWATAIIAIVSFFAPWQVGDDGLAWTWDVWSGSEAFHLVPLAAGVALVVLGMFESVPGIVVAGLALVAGLAWMLTSFDQFDPVFAAIGMGADDRATLAAAAAPVLLAGLAYRRAFRGSLVARVLLGLGALAMIAVFFVPMGPDGALGAQVGIAGPAGTGELSGILSAVPLAMLLLTSLGALLPIYPSSSGHGNLSTLALILLHAVAATIAFGHLPGFVGSLFDGASLGYGHIAAPIKVGALWYACLLWIGLGAGGVGAAVEAHVRRVRVSGYRSLAVMGEAPAQRVGPPAAPFAVSTAAGASGSGPKPLPSRPPGFSKTPLPFKTPLPARASAISPLAGGTVAPAMGPLPPPPGLTPPGVPAAPAFHISPTPPSGLSGVEAAHGEEVVEIHSSHALPILEPLQPARAAGADEAARIAAGPTLDAPPRATPLGERQTGRSSMPSVQPQSATASASPSTRALVRAAAASGPPMASAPARLAAGDTPTVPIAPSPSSPAPGRRSALAKTQFGMPRLDVRQPVAGAALPGPDGSGRTGATALGMTPVRPKPLAPPTPKDLKTGDTSRGMPAVQRSAAAGASGPASQRLWPPPGGLPRKQSGADRAADAQAAVRSEAIPTAPGGVSTPWSAVEATALRPDQPAAIRLVQPAGTLDAATPESVRHRVSNLQRQLARGAISAEEYHKRLDEILHGKRRG